MLSKSSSTDEIACWFIDTEYNEESFFVRHAYFTGEDKPMEKLKKAMDRVSDSASMPMEVKSLGRGIWELRVRLDHRIARVLFSPELIGFCNLALFAGIKKTQKTPTTWLNIAVDRRKHWRLRQISL